MKNLSKLFALSLLLAPGAAVAERWCDQSGEHVWKYRTALIPDIYNPGSGDLDDLTAVSNYVLSQCEHYWTNYASHVGAVIDSAGYRERIDLSGNPPRWRYSCLACRIGFPVFNPRPAVLGPAVVGDIVTDLVSGQLVSVVLHKADGDRPYYLADVLSKSEIVQVEVDATSGRAEVVKEEEGQGGICPQ